LRALKANGVRDVDPIKDVLGQIVGLQQIPEVLENNLVGIAS
jgi:hypothetical protein